MNYNTYDVVHVRAGYWKQVFVMLLTRKQVFVMHAA
jgi:hypothetical protein